MNGFLSTDGFNVNHHIKIHLNFIKMFNHMRNKCNFGSGFFLMYFLCHDLRFRLQRFWSFLNVPLLNNI